MMNVIEAQRCFKRKAPVHKERYPI